MASHLQSAEPARKPIPSAEALAQLPSDGGPEFNRLVFEKSPYLLQHAGNPVDWYPWGETAFNAAREAGKPIFLSIGYATCHWCHVMEHESFEDPEVAKLMNDAFICVKVDREELPHVDQVYMTFTQAMTGSGGWPMSVIMTADQKPFFAGTYFPKANFMRLINQVLNLWNDDREKVFEQAEGITAQLQQMSQSEAGDMLQPDVLDKAFQWYTQNYDDPYGGFAGPPRFAPKFPTPHDYSFLLRYWKREDAAKALEIVETSLTQMRLGGVYDQIGFGTHRYATDRQWLVPHFEKMLYDQALVAIANIETFQATGKERYKQTVDEIFTYVLRDMVSPEGGFYSAEDADSEGEEGKFYVWTSGEVIEVLGEKEGTWFSSLFNFVEEGNFLEESTQQRTGANIPHLKKPFAELAEEAGTPLEAFLKRVDAARVQLFEAREKRIHPLKDDKILTDWNGLMIAALARGAIAFDDDNYRQAASKAADFFLTQMRDENGRLYKRYRAGDAGLASLLEDYSYLTLGLTDLYEATFEPRYLSAAVDLTNILIEHHWDDQHGGFFMTADDGEKLIVRSKDAYDGALPSGNAVSALNLVRLARLTGHTDFEERAQGVMKYFSSEITQRGAGFSMMLQALDFLTGETREIVVVGDPKAENTKEILRAIQQGFDPNKVVLLKDTNAKRGDALAAIAPYVANQTSIDGMPTVYICRNFACELPRTDLAEIKAALGRVPAVSEE